jgi:hypothetical protein
VGRRILASTHAHFSQPGTEVAEVTTARGGYIKPPTEHDQKWQGERQDHGLPHPHNPYDLLNAGQDRPSRARVGTQRQHEADHEEENPSLNHALDVRHDPHQSTVRVELTDLKTKHISPLKKLSGM